MDAVTLPDKLFALMTVTGDHGSANVGGQDVRFSKLGYATAEEAAENAASFYDVQRKLCRWSQKGEDEEDEASSSELSDSGVDSDLEEEYGVDERKKPKAGLLLKGDRYCPDCILVELSLADIKASSSAMSQVTDRVYCVVDVDTDEGQCHSPDASWSRTVYADLQSAAQGAREYWGFDDIADRTGNGEGHDPDFDDNTADPTEGVVLSSYCRSVRIYRLMLPKTDADSRKKKKTPSEASLECKDQTQDEAFDAKTTARIEKLRQRDLEKEVDVDKHGSGWSRHTGTQLVKAAYTGNAREITALCAAGANLEAKCSSGWTPLMAAANQGRTRGLQALIRAGANLEARDESGCTPLHHATEENRPSTMKALIAAKASLAAVDYDGFSPLMRAAYSHEDKPIAVLLTAKADVHYVCQKEGMEGQTALHVAQRDNRQGAMKALVEAGANPNIKGQHGWTPLMTVAEGGDRNKKVVKTMLKHKADPNLKADDGSSALTWASVGGGGKSMVSLLAAKADPHLVVQRGELKGCTALGLASEEGWRAKAGLLALLKAGANPNVVGRQGMSPLISACLYQMRSFLAALLQAGADIKVKSDGTTPLLLMARNGDMKGVKTLLEHKADPHGADDDGKTVLMWLSEHGHIDGVTALLELNANVNAVSKEGATALTLATDRGNGKLNVLNLLLEHKADPNAKAYVTPLITMAQNANERGVAALLKYKPDCNAVNDDGKTALRLVVDLANWEHAGSLASKASSIATTLLACGADATSVKDVTPTPPAVQQGLELREAVEAWRPELGFMGDYPVLTELVFEYFAPPAVQVLDLLWQSPTAGNNDDDDDDENDDDNDDDDDDDDDDEGDGSDSDDEQP